MNLLRLLSSCLLPALLLTGCLSHTRDGDRDDAGAVPVDGALAIDAAISAACAPQDARGAGPCEAIVGHVWNGSFCVAISGCSCQGEDCDEIGATAEACLVAHEECVRSCGGLAELECLPSEYCDYPDGSFCGGDDSPGVCRARPVDCLEPGGVLVCGCDRSEYIGECSAYLAGTDVARLGPCVTTDAYDTAAAFRDCAPDDGPAWRISLTTSRTACDETRGDGRIDLVVWDALESATPGTVYALGGSEGQALICGRPEDPCASATGTFSFSVFAAGEVARFSYDVRTEDGRRFQASEIEVAAWWCDTGGPFCG